jgi:hypothetical protein
VANVLARFERAKRLREPWVAQYEECYELALPSRESFYAQAPAQQRTDKIFDETAVVGVQEFASRLQAGLVPNFARWADLVAGSEIPKEERSEVNASLEDVTDYVFEILQNSNFAQEVHEAFVDLALGTACLRVDEGDALNPIVFSAIPLPQLYLDVGPDDRVDSVFRLRTVKASNLSVAYRRGKMPAEVAELLAKGEDRYLAVIEATYRTYDRPAEERYKTCVVLPEFQAMLMEQEFGGTGSSPYIVFRWAKAAGEVWGRGPLLNALPAVRTTNLVVQMILENAQMAISGIYTMEDDGVVNPDTVRLLPGTIIPVAAGSGGLKSIQSAGSFDVAQLVLSDMRGNIKRALYNEMLGNPDRTPMSATEVTNRMADLSRQIGAAFGRLQAELVNPVLRRAIHILKQQGRINLPTVNGREVKVRATSPLAQSQNYQDIQSIDRFLELVQARFGPQMVNLLVKSEEASRFIASKFGVPDRVLRTDQERKQLMAQMAQVMGAMNGEASAGGGGPAGPSGGM